MSDSTGDFTASELRKLRSMKDAYGIQKFLDDAPYHLADTAWSPRRVLAEQTAHCLEGAIFAVRRLTHELVRTLDEAAVAVSPSR